MPNVAVLRNDRAGYEKPVILPLFCTASPEKKRALAIYRRVYRAAQGKHLFNILYDRTLRLGGVLVFLFHKIVLPI